jgi:hypothetical protein
MKPKLALCGIQPYVRNDPERWQWLDRKSFE